MSRVNTNEPAPTNPDCLEDLVEKLPAGLFLDSLVNRQACDTNRASRRAQHHHEDDAEASVGGTMQSTAGGVCLTPMLLGGHESGLSGTAWLDVVSTISTAMVCVFPA